MLENPEKAPPVEKSAQTVGPVAAELKVTFAGEDHTNKSNGTNATRCNTSLCFFIITTSSPNYSDNWEEGADEFYENSQPSNFPDDHGNAIPLFIPTNLDVGDYDSRRASPQFYRA